MAIFNKEEVSVNKHVILKSIDDGKVFVYPTDTIYGIGCDATNEDAVKKIRQLKQRHDNPFSVIAPSKEWILENCEISEENEGWLEKIPGPYTLILKLKNKDSIAPSVNVGMDTVGVRMPSHWLLDFFNESKKPIITTSANIQGKNNMTNLEDLDSELKGNLDFIIYDGEIKGRPSTLVHLHQDEVRIKER